jgi:hypothetical protein
MNEIVVMRPAEDLANLVQLAAQIDAAHERHEAAVRDGLAHARQAGDLLIRAKSALPHGKWLDWLVANSKVAPRTAQRYMRLAEQWREVVAKGGAAFGLHAALKLLTDVQDDSPDPNATRPSHMTEGTREALNLLKELAPARGPTREAGPCSAGRVEAHVAQLELISAEQTTAPGPVARAKPKPPALKHDDMSITEAIGRIGRILSQRAYNRGEHKSALYKECDQAMSNVFEAWVKWRDADKQRWPKQPQS